jgi:hypothetical protein
VIDVVTPSDILMDAARTIDQRLAVLPLARLQLDRDIAERHSFHVTHRFGSFNEMELTLTIRKALR